jgi:hypothetical protein
MLKLVSFFLFIFIGMGPLAPPPHSNKNPKKVIYRLPVVSFELIHFVVCDLMFKWSLKHLQLEKIWLCCCLVSQVLEPKVLNVGIFTNTERGGESVLSTFYHF